MSIDGQVIFGRKNYRRMSITLSGVAVFLLASCANFSGIDTRATLASPEQVGLKANAAGSPTSLTWPEDKWWSRYQQPELDLLVERALAQSPGIRIAEARIARAQSIAGVARSAEYLQISGAIDSTYQRFSANSIIPPPLGGTSDSSNSANLNLGYDLDFFGRNRAAIAAALGQVDASKADSQLARVALAANVTKTYFQLARLIEQRAVADETLKLREKTRQLVQMRVSNGLDTRVELKQAEGGLPTARLEVAQLDEQIAALRNSLDALTASPSGANRELTPHLITQATTADSNLSSLPAIPADLLGRRADIVAARERVRAASKDIAAQKAEFYPNINLIAFAGFSSIGYSNWIDAGSRQYGIGPAIRIPIFAGGRLRAALGGKTADYDIAVESYNQILFDAVRDVADQVTAMRSIGVQIAEQRDALAAAESAYDLALKRYQVGLTNYLTVLIAENAVLSQRRLAVDLRARAIDITVNLSRALGGGYQSSPDAATGAAGD